MCRNCGRVKYVTSPSVNVDLDSYYRTVENINVVYDGPRTICIEGCASGARYIFLPGRTRNIDKNDAECIVDLKGFEYVGMDSD